MAELNLFQLGEIKLSSGQRSFFKIECEMLTDSDWECLARLAVERVPPFGKVFGVPQGGIPFARALALYCRPHCPRVLIADDVYTTGESIGRFAREMQGKHKFHIDDTWGIVAFARDPINHDWVRAVFQMTAAEYR